MTSDVAGGAIAIQTDDHHGQLLVHYLVTPAAGDGKLIGDSNSSHTQYALLAPKQILVASGTIERGSGVYYDLKPSTQDTLQKQREFACLFDVPANWRANYIIVKCKALGVKRWLLGDSEVNCGTGLLSVGLYKQGDGEAMAAAYELGKSQQKHLNQSPGRHKVAKKAAPLPKEFDGAKQKIGASHTAGDLVEATEDKAIQAELPSAGDEVAAAKKALRKLNSTP